MIAWDKFIDVVEPFFHTFPFFFCIWKHTLCRHPFRFLIWMFGQSVPHFVQIFHGPYHDTNFVAAFLTRFLLFQVFDVQVAFGDRVSLVAFFGSDCLAKDYYCFAIFLRGRFFFFGAVCLFVSCVGDAGGFGRLGPARCFPPNYPALRCLPAWWCRQSRFRLSVCGLTWFYCRFFRFSVIFSV